MDCAPTTNSVQFMTFFTLFNCEQKKRKMVKNGEIIFMCTGLDEKPSYEVILIQTDPNQGLLSNKP